MVTDAQIADLIAGPVDQEELEVAAVAVDLDLVIMELRHRYDAMGNIRDMATVRTVGVGNPAPCPETKDGSS